MVFGPLLIATLVATRAPQPAREPRRVYGYTSALLSRHPANGAEYHRVADRLGGHTWVIVGGGGGFLTPSIGLEGEFAYGGTVSAPQRFSYTFSEEYIAVNRDVLINELVRYGPDGRAAVQLVAGGGYAHTSTQQTSVVEIDIFGKRTPQSYTPKSSYNGITVTVGVDALFRGGRHADIGPTFRLRWLRRPGGGETGWNGIGNYAFQFGAAVFFR